MTIGLGILRLADVCRHTGYDRKTVLGRLAEDEADGTPGLRFPPPLRPVGKWAKKEWHWRDVADWIERRKA